MFIKKIFFILFVLVVIIFLIFLYNEITVAHCDTLEGPVVAACKKSLETGNINYTLIWVQEKDEQIIKDAFKKTLQVRKLGEEAKELADMNFFETVVRIHRSGEGAAYTGLKPAGTDLSPAVPAGDKAIETGSLNEVEKIIVDAVKNGLHRHYAEVMEKKNYDHDNVIAGREFVKAYVEYIHYIERLYENATMTPEGHFKGNEIH
ncbi:MAG TPA: DUF6448 family protein [Ignavibacteria bacterium]